MNRKELQLARYFSPSAPIHTLRSFAGRGEQLSRLTDAVLQRGRHAIVYGERGVGKTSIVSILDEYLGGEQDNPPFRVVKIVADQTHSFTSIWHALFRKIPVATAGKPTIGFTSSPTPEGQELLSSYLPKDGVNPEMIRSFVASVTEQESLVVIIDEFDRVDPGTRNLFADLIKIFSDEAIDVTLVLVGVSDTVEGLLSDHASVTRALSQIHMPRMSYEDLEQIVSTGFGLVDMVTTEEALNLIVRYSQGLPSYTHLLSLHAGRAALRRGRDFVEVDDVEAGTSSALKDAEASVNQLYHKATASPRRNALYAYVALACAFSGIDERGYFRASEVKEPLMTLLPERKVTYSTFKHHLKHFCEDSRGPMLVRKGITRNFRYRFVDPLIPPYIVLNGIANGLVSTENALQLLKLRTDKTVRV